MLICVMKKEEKTHSDGVVDWWKKSRLREVSVMPKEPINVAVSDVVTTVVRSYEPYEATRCALCQVSVQQWLWWWCLLLHLLVKIYKSDEFDETPITMREAEGKLSIRLK